MIGQDLVAFPKTLCRKIQRAGGAPQVDPWPGATGLHRIGARVEAPPSNSMPLLLLSAIQHVRRPLNRPRATDGPRRP
jgi:hypothetical protein